MVKELKFPRRSLGAPFVVKEAPWLFWIVEMPSSALHWLSVSRNIVLVAQTYMLKSGRNKNSLHATIVRFSSSTKSK